MAAQGNRVTVIDPSPDALAALARRADEEGVADRVTGLQGDLGNLVELAPEGGVDLVLCHGVLGLVDDPAGGAGTRSPRCCGPAVPSPCWSASGTPPCWPGRWPATSPRPGPCSTREPDRPERAETGRRAPVHRRGARPACSRQPASPAARHGIRVFTDLVPSSLLDLEPGASAALLELERAVSERPEYLTLASQLHVVATR